MLRQVLLFLGFFMIFQEACSVGSNTVSLLSDESTSSAYSFILPRISSERIKQKQEFYHEYIQRLEQKRAWAYGGIGFLGTCFLLYVGSLIMKSYESSALNSVELTHRSQNNVIHEHVVSREFYENWKNQRTFTGRIKKGVTQGITLAFCSLIVGLVLNISSSVNAQVTTMIKQFFNENEKTLLAQVSCGMEQDITQFRQSVFYFFDDIICFEKNGQKLDQQMKEYVCNDIIVTYHTLVNVFENFVALILENLECIAARDQDKKQAINRGIMQAKDLISGMGEYGEKIINQILFDKSDHEAARLFINQFSISLSRIIRFLGTTLYGQGFEKI